MQEKATRILARILCDPEIASSLPATRKTFSIPVVIYKLGLPISNKIFDFNKYVN